MAERERQGKISKIKGPKPNPHFEVHILKSVYVGSQKTWALRAARMQPFSNVNKAVRHLQIPFKPP